MAPLKPGAGGIARPSSTDELSPLPSAAPERPGAVRLLRLSGLERANLLLLVSLVAAGFGSSSAQVGAP